MRCNFYIADEYGQIETNLESLPLVFVKNIVDLAKQNELSFLEGIETKGETIFNPIQVIQLKHNLLTLQQAPLIKQNIQLYQSFLVAIDKIINEGSYTYLKIICPF